MTQAEAEELRRYLGILLGNLERMAQEQKISGEDPELREPGDGEPAPEHWKESKKERKT